MTKNLELVDDVEKIAKKKGCTPGQLAIAWVKQMSGKKGMPVIIPIPGATLASRVNENLVDVHMTDEEVAELDKVVKEAEIVGARYPTRH